MKIYISADMEGAAGVVTGEQLGPQGFEYQRFREFMTREVNAAVEAALEAGATEIVVSDSHGNGQNLLIERFYYENYASELSGFCQRLDGHFQPEPFQPPDEVPLDSFRVLPVEVVSSQLLPVATHFYDATVSAGLARSARRC